MVDYAPNTQHNVCHTSAKWQFFSVADDPDFRAETRRYQVHVNVQGCVDIEVVATRADVR